MSLSDHLQSDFLLIHENISDKDAALRRIAQVAKQDPALENVDEEVILNALREREHVGSTGFGNGIAIPHCRFSNISDFVVGVLTTESPIAFDAIDGQPVQIIAFIVGPEAETNRHLKLLSALSLSLSSEEARKSVIAATDPESLVAALGGVAASTEAPEAQGGSRLFHIVVQDESVFDQLLGVFEGIDGSSVTVIESRNSGSYLARLPLFSSLLSDAPGSFNRVIMATAREEMSNEAFRQIEMLTGPLDDRRDVLVVVQDVLHAAGGLSV